MEDPVFTSDGHTYERAAIATWLETHGTSPMTGEPLEHRRLTPNRLLRSQICEARQQGRARTSSAPTAGPPMAPAVTLASVAPAATPAYVESHPGHAIPQAAPSAGGRAGGGRGWRGRGAAAPVGSAIPHEAMSPGAVTVGRGGRGRGRGTSRGGRG